ncbi:PREDICTED: RNA-binding protein Rsf1 [Nicrophorus vespilloides]|uniref:RNA-binding protein Rsf1 n=1 Tax=Nicrophorus vespilloides TaxID=110193 RepID=A0ABM1M0K8_NICVS|nr:PREDICTED: RNA-binding protein Rsf1 [Nicrophorus vespilloides]
MGERDSDKGTRVFVGGLTETIKKEDLEGEFEKYGKLNSVWVAFNPPGFAFIEFCSHGDAETACDNLNGSDFLGSKLRVEIARGSGRRGGFRGARGARRGSTGRGGNGGGSFRSYSNERGSTSFRGARGTRGSRGGGRYDDYGAREERSSYGSRDYNSRNGDSLRRGSRETFRARGTTTSSSGGGGGARRFDSNSRFRSRSPVPRR